MKNELIRNISIKRGQDGTALIEVKEDTFEHFNVDTFEKDIQKFFKAKAKQQVVMSISLDALAMLLILIGVCTTGISFLLESHMPCATICFFLSSAVFFIWYYRVIPLVGKVRLTPLLSAIGYTAGCFVLSKMLQTFGSISIFAFPVLSMTISALMTVCFDLSKKYKKFAKMLNELSRVKYKIQLRKADE